MESAKRLARFLRQRLYVWAFVSGVVLAVRFLSSIAPEKVLWAVLLGVPFVALVGYAFWMRAMFPFRALPPPPGQPPYRKAADIDEWRTSRLFAWWLIGGLGSVLVGSAWVFTHDGLTAAMTAGIVGTAILGALLWGTFEEIAIGAAVSDNMVSGAIAIPMAVPLLTAGLVELWF
jgi:hypothetical protein